MSVLDVSKLTISYAGSNEDAVHDLSFSVGAAESVGIVGESGAGKSQTALAIMGLLPANAQTSGSIRIGDTEVIGAAPATLRKLRARKVSMIFQDPTTALNPYTRVGNQLKRILLEHSIVSRPQVRDKCVEMLERVGLPEPHLQYHAFPHQLSGGMRQRVLIAAALIVFNPPRLLSCGSEEVAQPAYEEFPQTLGFQYGEISGIGLSYQVWRESLGFQVAGGIIYIPTS